MPNHALRRLDRHVVHVGLLMVLWLGGFGVMIVPIDGGVLGDMASSTQTLLGACLFVGTRISLGGACLGPGGIWPVRNFARHIEVRHAYLIHAGGMIAVEVALGQFAVAIVTSNTVIGTTTGATAPVMFWFYAVLIKQLLQSSAKMTRNHNMIKAAISPVEAQ